MLDQTALRTTTADTAEGRDRFVEVLRPHLPALDSAEELDFDRPLKEVGLTSMRAVDLLLDIEDGFAVSFPDTALTDENFHSAGTLWQVVVELLDAGRGTP